MTHVQQKQHLDELKAVLHGQTMDSSPSSTQMNSNYDSMGLGDKHACPPDPSILDVKHAHPPDPMQLSDLPDNYLCEGSPDKMMLDEFKEHNIQDI